MPEELRHIFEVMYLDSRGKLLTELSCFHKHPAIWALTHCWSLPQMGRSPALHCVLQLGAAPRSCKHRWRIEDAFSGKHSHLFITYYSIDPSTRIRYNDNCGLLEGRLLPFPHGARAETWVEDDARPLLPTWPPWTWPSSTPPFESTLSLLLPCSPSHHDPWPFLISQTISTLAMLLLSWADDRWKLEAWT